MSHPTRRPHGPRLDHRARVAPETAPTAYRCAVPHPTGSTPRPPPRCADRAPGRSDAASNPAPPTTPSDDLSPHRYASTADPPQPSSLSSQILVSSPTRCSDHLKTPRI